MSAALLGEPPSYSFHHLDLTEGPQPIQQHEKYPPVPPLNSTRILPDGVIQRTNSGSSSQPALTYHQLPNVPPPNLSLSSDAINVMFTEAVTFVRPPSVIEPTSSSAGITFDEGQGSHLCGFVYVVLTKPQTIKCLKVRLWAACRLAFKKSQPVWEDEVLFEKELVIAGDSKKGLFLEKGLSTWEFNFFIPPSAPPYEKSVSGRIFWRTSATLIGSARNRLLKRDLTIEKQPWIYVNPSTENAPLQFTHHQESYSDIFGPYRLQISSDSFIIGGPITLSFALSAPPSTLTIYAINVYIKQTCRLTSKNGRSEVHEGGKKFVCQLGAKAGYAMEAFEDMARKKGVVLEGKETGFWRAEKIARIPDSKQLRPTTFGGTASPLKFASELFFDVVFNNRGPGVTDTGIKIACLFSKEVNIASCCCTLDILSLPEFTPSSDPAVQPFMGDDQFCMCDTQWQSIAERELAVQGRNKNSRILGLLRGGQEEVDSEGLRERRRGVVDGFDILRMDDNVPFETVDGVDEGARSGGGATRGAKV